MKIFRINYLNIKQFYELLNGNNSIVLVGAGRIGSIICKFLIQNGIKPVGVIDNDSKKWGQALVDDVKIFSLEEAVSLYGRYATFFITIAEYSTFDSDQIAESKIIRYLVEHQCYSVGIWDAYSSNILITEKALMKHIKNNDIDMNGELLDLGKVCIPNFMNKFGEDIRRIFLFDCGDLILPTAFNDYSNIDEGPYEYKNVILQQGDIVLDCGANIGLFSAVAASKGCKVYAFEPVADTVEILNYTREIYRDNIEISSSALTNIVGKIPMVIKKNIADNTIRETISELGKKILIDATTIDEFVRTNKLTKVDFIKADIEGAERVMLEGAKETLKRFAPKLSICTYHLKDDPEVLEKLIKKINSNYVIEHHCKKLYAYVPQ